jgi:hypothetical protein
MTNNKKDKITTTYKKNYIVTKNESRIPQTNKWIYGITPIALGIFWYCL